MTAFALAILAVVAAYLIGAIPFAYLVVRGIKGIDIRTVGSGNVGATNVGRVMGFRYFLLVFGLDVLKGLLPTLGLPRGVAALAGGAVPSLGVLVALATILGHNFPVYLGFRGGKGVATSLGAMAALDPAASLAAAVGFCTFLLVTRYVSLSSILGGIVFAVVHFWFVDRPWGRDHWAMSVLTIGLLGMLIVRHRKNFARIAAGTEPSVTFRRKRPPSGRVGLAPLLVLALAAGAGAMATGVAIRAHRVDELRCGAFTLRALARYSTGHQRAERVAFADRGRLLAVTCPRYNRVVLYRVTAAESLEVVRDLELDGRPVAVWPARDRLFVLQRPRGDARHVEAGYWETLDFQGRRIGSKVRVGFDPDDLVVTADGRRALVLTSGHAEGEMNRPPPAIEVFDIASDHPRVVARVEFDQPGDDPERITLSATGGHAAVTLRGSDQVAGIDLTEIDRPTIRGRVPLAVRDVPYPSRSGDDWIVMPVDSEREVVSIAPAGYLAGTLPSGSGLEILHATTDQAVSLGALPLRGPANLGTVRPTGLAYSPERGLLAVANRSGGIHLVAIRPSAPEFAARDSTRHQ